MKRRHTPMWMVAATALTATVSLTACDDEPDSPGEAVERAGEEVGDALDDAVDGAGDALEDLGDDIEDATDGGR